jgi:GntR family transcriptional regulator
VFLRIEKGSSVSNSRQIADQIRALCLAGALKPNEQLPSVRQLARELAVNQNTVLRVYERLSAEGWLEMRHGDGTYVTHRPPIWRMNGQRQQFADELQQLVRRGLMLGLSTDELRELLDQALASQAEAAALSHNAQEPSP